MNNLVQLVQDGASLEEVKMEVYSHLIDYKKQVNVTLRDGTSALLVACLDGNRLDIAQFLLENGAEVNMCNSMGNTPLLGALMCDDEVLVNLLLEYGADLSFKNNRGVSILDMVNFINLKENNYAVINGTRYKLVHDKVETKPTGQSFTFSVREGNWKVLDCDGNIVVNTGVSQ